jgi:RNA polymerase sigma-70 factor (ECF subfamily)
MHSSDRSGREHGLRSAVLAGDERAWRTWYDESFAALDAYVSWRCAGQRDLANEVIQEAWLTAVRRIRHFDPDQGSFAGWLRGIAVNVLRNHLRKRRHDARRCHPIREGQPADAGAATEDRVARITAALAALPARYEAVLRAKYLEQCSVAEIANSWNESAKAVESLLSRARLAFREAYLRLE